MAYIAFKDISKRYPGCISCQEINLDIQQATIHAIVGENGAGKSTLMNILGGLVAPTTGTISLGGRDYAPDSALDAYKNKIAYIHQHFVLARQLTAFENILLSSSAPFHPLSQIPLNKIRKDAEILLKKFNWNISLDSKVENISVGEQQRLEILKALLLDPDIFIFDEPTAVLTPQEANNLMDFLVELRSQGKTVILISHKLNEIKKVADFVTILRAGRLVVSESMSKMSIDQMAENMIGRKTNRSFNFARSGKAKVALQLPGTATDIYCGEIFGVAGIEGNGQSELIRALIHHCRMNNVRFGDITEDRLPLSIFPGGTLVDHLVLRHPSLMGRMGLIDLPKAREETKALIGRWDVRPGLPDQVLNELSGGNQQKFMVGRELYHDPDLLIAAHPTRGVDLGALEMIHQAMIEFSKKEKTVILISSDLDEILQLAARFIILHQKKIYGPFDRNSLNEMQIGHYMTGHSQ